MKSKKVLSLLLAGAMTAALLAAPAQAAEAPPSIRISSYKGNTLQAGDRSGLIINGVAQSVISVGPEIVAVKNAGGLWVAVAKSGGTAVLTVTGLHGETASLTLTVGDPAPFTAEAPAPAAKLEAVRQELIRLVNEVRRKTERQSCR